MPFIYRRDIANIDRSEKRDDDFIHENMMRGLEIIAKDSGSNYIHIMPVRFKDPAFDKADPKKFLVLYAIKMLGLNLYEVEHWLDVIIENKGISRSRSSRPFIDERRRYFRQAHKRGSGLSKLFGGSILTQIIYQES